MTSTINASTSSGIVQTADTSGVLAIQANGTTGMTFGPGAAVATTNTINTPGVSLAFKNRIINGGMTIDQRNAGASVTPTGGSYTLDRWRSEASQASKYSVQQSSTAPAGFINSMVVTSLSAYSVLATDEFLQRHNIEGLNVADLGWGTVSAQPVTLSFWVRSSLTGTFGGSLQNSATNRCYPFSYTISAANTFEYKTITIAGDTTGTWLTTNGVGIRVNFGLGVGSTYSGAAGAWSSTYYSSATGATSVVGTNGATFYITGVQLEVGTAATAFEFRDYGRELIMCQRYYQYSSSYAFGLLAQSASGYRQIPVAFITTMRAIPTTGIVWDHGTPGTQFGNTQSIEAFTYLGNTTDTAVINSWTASAEL